MTVKITSAAVNTHKCRPTRLCTTVIPFKHTVSDGKSRAYIKKMAERRVSSTIDTLNYVVLSLGCLCFYYDTDSINEITHQKN